MPNEQYSFERYLNVRSAVAPSFSHDGKRLSFLTSITGVAEVPWRRTLREAEYGSLEQDREFLEQISPIHQVDRISSPLFVVHGANDPRVPVGEAEQIAAALRARNVPVEYMRFEDE